MKKYKVIMFAHAIFNVEAESEEKVLKMITADDEIHTVIKTGSFYSGNESEVFGVNVYQCQGGYLRAEKDIDSVMFVLTPKETKAENADL